MDRQIQPSYPLDLSIQRERVLGTLFRLRSLLEIVRQYLADDLSVEDFSETWQSSVVIPTRHEEVKYDALAQRLERGEIIPVLGPEVHVRSGQPFPSSEQLVQRLSQEAHYDDFHGPLSMISQYYVMTEYGRGTLLQHVQQSIEGESEQIESYPLYELLAGIREPIVVISAC